MVAAPLLAFFTGFLSLSLEILWLRLFSFTNHSLPQAFAFVLAVYLLGIALGASLGKKCCHQSWNLWKVSGLVLLLSGVAGLISPWLYAHFAHTSLQLWVGGILIMLTALFTAIIFPIAHHLGTLQSGSYVGRSLSSVYVANIAGATLGPLFVGMVLLSFFTTQQSFIICAAFSFLVAAYCLFATTSFAKMSVMTLLMLGIISMALSADKYSLMRKTALPLGEISRIIENQYGTVAIYKGGKAGDIVTGGNVYDGRTNLDPAINSNGINRVIILAALHEQPERVLMIGLSIGSWLKIVTGFPGVKHIDVVEINPGYVDAIQAYPAQLSALKDKRVHLYIDDGRRWLKAHKDEQYDMVIINATYHWRAYSTNLLSRDFLQLLKHHMKKNAILTYNTTGSLDVLKTAASVFEYAYLYENFVVASAIDSRKKMQTKKAEKKLASLSLDGKPLFPPHHSKIAQRFLHLPMLPLEAVQPLYEALGRPLEVITDNNLITEYKYGERLKAVALH